MSGLIRVVVDTNVFYIAFYNPSSKAMRVLNYAIENKLSIFSPDTVREELSRLLISDFAFDTNEKNTIIESLPVQWVGKEFYANHMKGTDVIVHKPDRPLLACALGLRCGILTANIKHFKPARKVVTVWDINELLKELSKHEKQ